MSNNEYRVLENNNPDGNYLSVVDSEGYPINDGHFTDLIDAEYVRDQMNTGRFSGDNVSNLARSAKSWIVR